MILVGNFAGKF